MSVSVLALKLRLLVVAVVVVSIDPLVENSIDEVQAACPAAAAEPSAGALIRPSRRPEDPAARLQDSGQVVRDSGFLARPSDASAHNLSLAAPARQRTTIASTVSSTEYAEMSGPSRGNAIPTLAPPSATPLALQAEAGPGVTLVQRENPNAAIGNIAILADTYDETRLSPMWPGSQPPTALSKLAMLSGACGGVAIGICGLAVFVLRRRRQRAFTNSNELFARHGQSPQTDFASDRS
jgi:hypothetical protein